MRENKVNSKYVVKLLLKNKTKPPQTKNKKQMEKIWAGEEISCH